jgi:hypothetical protein
VTTTHQSYARSSAASAITALLAPPLTIDKLYNAQTRLQRVTINEILFIRRLCPNDFAEQLIELDEMMGMGKPGLKMLLDVPEVTLPNKTPFHKFHNEVKVFEEDIREINRFLNSTRVDSDAHKRYVHVSSLLTPILTAIKQVKVLVKEEIDRDTISDGHIPDAYLSMLNKITEKATKNSDLQALKADLRKMMEKLS